MFEQVRYVTNEQGRVGVLLDLAAYDRLAKLTPPVR